MSILIWLAILILVLFILGMVYKKDNFGMSMYQGYIGSPTLVVNGNLNGPSSITHTNMPASKRFKIINPQTKLGYGGKYNRWEYDLNNKGGLTEEDKKMKYKFPDYLPTARLFKSNTDKLAQKYKTIKNATVEESLCPVFNTKELKKNGKQYIKDKIKKAEEEFTGMDKFTTSNVTRVPESNSVTPSIASPYDSQLQTNYITEENSSNKYLNDYWETTLSKSKKNPYFDTKEKLLYGGKGAGIFREDIRFRKWPAGDGNTGFNGGISPSGYAYSPATFSGSMFGDGWVDKRFYPATGWKNPSVLQGKSRDAYTKVTQ